MVESATQAYLAAADAADETAAIPAANGLVLSPSDMTSLLLGDRSSTAGTSRGPRGKRWDIAESDAVLVLPGVLTVAPRYLRQSAASARVSFELRIRGAQPYRMAVDRGTAVVTHASRKPTA